MPKATPEKPNAQLNGSQQPGAKGDKSEGEGDKDKNEGEGNRTAARRYNKAVQNTVRSGQVPQKAREAARALEGPEGAELRRAEEEGKSGKSGKGN